MEIPEHTLSASEFAKLSLFRPPPPEGAGAPSRWPMGNGFADSRSMQQHLLSSTDPGPGPSAGPGTDPLPLSTAYQYALHFAQMHPGFDTIVMPRRMLPGVINTVGSVFVGFPPVGGILAEAVSHSDRGCVATRHVPATFHVGSRNGQWGANNTWGVNNVSTDAARYDRRAASVASVMLDLNHRLAREARDRAVAAGVAAGARGIPHSTYRVGRRCKEASRLPEKCYAGQYYSQSVLKYVLP